MDLMLPFKTGDMAEARSFTKGFRGAWFRCKISEISVRNSHLECYLEYIDFPDEKKTWTRLYKTPPGYRKQKSSESRQIMIRPRFPQWYRENQLPEQYPKTDVIAVVSDPWKVGDLIDWWEDDCYWTATIIELLGDDKFKVELIKPPMGEGGCYDADCKDIRPTLDWSLEKGWSVPLSWANGKSWYTAELIHQIPDKEDSSSDEDISCHDNEQKLQKCLNGVSDMPLESLDSSNLKDLPNTISEDTQNNQTDSSGVSTLKSRTNLKNKASSPIAKPGDAPVVGTDNQVGTHSSSDHRTSSTEHSSMQSPDTVEDAIMQLEEVANKFRWLKDLLLSLGSPLSDTTKPSWKLLEKDASCKRR